MNESQVLPPVTASSQASNDKLESNTTEQKTNNGRKRLSNEWWLWEILAMAVSVSAWTALIVILVVTNGERQDKRFRVISINAVVSLLVTLARTTMMIGVSSSVAQSRWLWFRNAPRPLYDMEIFDMASRGVYGSFVFLFSIRWHIASLGALVTILSVGVDTFAQQVVQIESRFVGVSSTSATFAFAHSYSAGAKVSQFGDDIQPRTVHFGMQGAILKGLFGLEISNPYSCPGACSWEQTYTSLGFSSSCQNVTQATLAKQKCAPIGKISGQDCNMTTPSGFNLSTSIVPTEYSTTFIIVTDATTGQPTGTMSSILNSNPSWRGNETFSPNNFTRMAIYRAPPSYNVGAHEISGAAILECGISLTAYEYSDIKVNGTQTSQKIVEMPLTKNGTIKLDPPTSKLAGPYVFFNEPGLPEFTITRTDWRAIHDFFASSQFSGSYVEGNAPTGVSGVANIAAVPLYSANVTQILNDITRSMTNQLRSTKPGMELATGLTSVPVGFIVVQWEYLALPLVTALCSLILLVILIVHSRRSRQVPLWKSSSLALLDHQVRQEDGMIVGTYSSVQGLEEAAKGIKVKLI